MTATDIGPKEGVEPDDLVTIVAMSLRDNDRWELTGLYFETEWSEVLGPTATLLARRLGRIVEHDASPATVSLARIGGSRHRAGQGARVPRPAQPPRHPVHQRAGRRASCVTKRSAGAAGPRTTGHGPDRRAVTVRTNLMRPTFAEVSSCGRPGEATGNWGNGGREA